MSQWKCNACGGTYNDRARDGTVYMHACAPAPPDPHGIQAELPNKRDETIVFDGSGGPRDILAAGAGVTPMQGQAASEPEWIINLRADYRARA